jgi:hypothetical protein
MQSESIICLVPERRAHHQRCKSGGHECVFEESNRGKRSTRKNEALAAKVAKMDAALRSIGGVSA